MNCREIITAHLKANGYDGLCNWECGCMLDDLRCCGSDWGECKPGYLHKAGCTCANCKDLDKDGVDVICSLPVCKPEPA